MRNRTKEGFIEKHGEAAYEKILQQSRVWLAQHREEHNTTQKKWCDANPKKVKANNQEHGRKGGKYYKKALEYQHTGLSGKRNRIRWNHGHKYHSFKKIIAPESRIHHEWIPGTAEYTGVALVETDQHMYGFVDVIKILDGKITLLTEKEVKGVL